MDRIEIRGVAGYGYHGVLVEEKKQGQQFRCDTTLWIDHSVSAQTDNLADTISYADVSEVIIRHITGPSVNLIERLAWGIAHELMDSYLALQAVEVTIHKPQAPIKAEFDDVAVVVRISRKKHASEKPTSPQPAAEALAPGVIVLSLGSNMGNSRQLLLDAADNIPALTAISPLYETQPWGNKEQNNFLNCIITAASGVLSPQSWLSLAQDLEKKAGRERSEVWGPRTLDVDIIAFSRAPTIEEPGLIVPHPHAHERAFVLGPWLAIDSQAQLWHNDKKVPVADLWQKLPESEKKSIAVKEKNWYSRSYTV